MPARHHTLPSLGSPRCRRARQLHSLTRTYLRQNVNTGDRTAPHMSWTGLKFLARGRDGRLWQGDKVSLQQGINSLPSGVPEEDLVLVAPGLS